MWRAEELAGAGGSAAMRWLRAPELSDSGDDLPGHSQTADALVSGDVGCHEPEERCQCHRDPEGVGLGQLRYGLDLAAQIAASHGATGSGRLAGSLEVDETFWGSEEEGMRGRQTESKVLVVIAAQEDGKGIGRIRMRRIPDASAQSLMPFVEDAIEPGSLVHTDGWSGYDPLEGKGYRHRITLVKGRKESASDLLPRVHLVASLLKRWLLGTHQGAVSREHLDYYLDEFTFRFNRRNSRSRGKLFLRLAEQAVAVGPSPYKSMVRCYAGAAASNPNI